MASTRSCTPVFFRSIPFLVALLAWIAIAAPARFHCDVPDSVLDSFVQSMTQRS